MNETTLQYIDPFSILVVDATGNLKRLFCPFKVVSLLSDSFKADQVVEMVRKTGQNEILFLIDCQYLQHHLFKII